MFRALFSVISTGQLSRSSALPEALTDPWLVSISSASSFMLPSILLTLSSMLKTVRSVSPVRRNCSPLNSSILRFSGRCTSVISGRTGFEKRSFSVSPSGFSSGCGFWIFGSTISSCATSATFGSAISSPCREVGVRVRFFSCQRRPEVKSITDTVVSSILIFTLSSATR
ncbi:Uncharacterised protein [Enterobacter cloacae]|nr:Uncharacterised protein [Enterobacter cloacae]